MDRYPGKRSRSVMLWCQILLVMSCVRVPRGVCGTFHCTGQPGLGWKCAGSTTCEERGRCTAFGRLHETLYERSRRCKRDRPDRDLGHSPIPPTPTCETI